MKLKQIIIKIRRKRFYTATLIPGMVWIGYGFKNTTINSYKYPLKNQEDEVIIQLDKINQNQFFTY
jgi:endoglucanase Acf2